MDMNDFFFGGQLLSKPMNYKTAFKTVIVSACMVLIALGAQRDFRLLSASSTELCAYAPGRIGVHCDKQNTDCSAGSMLRLRV